MARRSRPVALRHGELQAASCRWRCVAGLRGWLKWMMKFKDGLQNITIFTQNIKLRGWLANYYILIFTKNMCCHSCQGHLCLFSLHLTLLTLLHGIGASEASDSKNMGQIHRVKKIGAKVELELKTRAVMQLAQTLIALINL